MGICRAARHPVRDETPYPARPLGTAVHRSAVGRAQRCRRRYRRRQVDRPPPACSAPFPARSRSDGPHRDRRWRRLHGRYGRSSDPRVRHRHRQRTVEGRSSHQRPFHADDVSRPPMASSTSSSPPADMASPAWRRSATTSSRSRYRNLMGPSSAETHCVANAQPEIPAASRPFASHARGASLRGERAVGLEVAFLERQTTESKSSPKMAYGSSLTVILVPRDRAKPSSPGKRVE